MSHICENCHREEKAAMYKPLCINCFYARGESGRVYLEPCKPAPEPSAEELADDIAHCISGGGTIRLYDVIKLIEADRAHQRQAGREEMLATVAESLDSSYAKGVEAMEARYADVVEAARDALPIWEDLCTCAECEQKQEAVRKALRDLGESKEVPHD